MGDAKALPGWSSALTAWRRLGIPWLVGGALAGVVLLAGQTLWLFFEHGARTPALRPAYAAGCAVFGCELPPLRSLAAWSATTVALRPHPAGPGFLLRATITNQAEYPQPWPVLIARFTDIDGAPIAEQSFTPAAYLPGAAPDLSAPGASIAVKVAATDPGVGAVNYAMSFAWPAAEPSSGMNPSAGSAVLPREERMPVRREDTGPVEPGRV